MEISYSIQLEEEYDAPDDYFCSGDEDADRETIKWIHRELRAGNQWAWCCVKVTATVELDGCYFTGYNCLGACNYRSEEEFKQEGGYFEYMKREAVEDLKNNLESIRSRGGVAARILMDPSLPELRK